MVIPDYLQSQCFPSTYLRSGWCSPGSWGQGRALDFALVRTRRALRDLKGRGDTGPKSHETSPYLAAQPTVQSIFTGSGDGDDPSSSNIFSFG